MAEGSIQKQRNIYKKKTLINRICEDNLQALSQAEQPFVKLF